ncbi:MAG: selenoneine synthase SenA [Pseudomonadota bacterium]
MAAVARVYSLQQMLLDARARTLALVSDLTGAQLMGPQLAIVNPPLWEIGHLAWFQERWCLRQVDGTAQLLPSLRPDADRLYDSAAVAHATRWSLSLPTFDETIKYMQRVLERVLERLANAQSESLAYFTELAALHEEMHCEAFTYTWQTLGYAAPHAQNINAVHAGSNAKGDAELPGGCFMLGATRDAGFVFDNEKWAHEVIVRPYAISRTCVSNQEFLAFVEEGGYTRRECWSETGWRWREMESVSHPLYWRQDGSTWRIRRFDSWAPLVMSAAMVHANWYEADAYCKWAGRRLPSEAEWEYAAAAEPEMREAKRHYPWGEQAPDETRANLFGMHGGVIDVAALAAGDSAWGCRQMIGNVWEWTADAFQPYPGFVVDPYKEYSQPWFGSHKVLRGGSFATASSLIRNTWRNFYTPERRDIYAGFRTCA